MAALRTIILSANKEELGSQPAVHEVLAAEVGLSRNGRSDLDDLHLSFTFLPLDVERVLELASEVGQAIVAGKQLLDVAGRRRALERQQAAEDRAQAEPVKNPGQEEEDDETEDEQYQQPAGHLKVDGHFRQINHFFFPCLTREGVPPASSSTPCLAQ